MELNDAYGGPYEVAGRFWRGNAPEWDVVCRSRDGKRLLVGEAKWSAKPFDRGALERLAHAVLQKPRPALHAPDAARQPTRALFVPLAEKGVPRLLAGVHVVRGSALFSY